MSQPSPALLLPANRSAATTGCLRRNRSAAWRHSAGAAGLALLVACGGETRSAVGGGGEGSGDGASFEPALLRLPPGFPAPHIPVDNPLTAAKVELGRHLFYDPRLSGNGTQSCASCHQQALAFSDGHATTAGSTGQALPRNSPGLANVAYNATLTWANPALTTLEAQIPVPLFGETPVELGVQGREAEVLARFANDARYQSLFDAAYPGEPAPVRMHSVVAALASFVRTLISGRSPFDRFAYDGDSNALSPAARRGLELFFSERLECHHCHGGFNFSHASVHANSPTDASLFHNTGLYNLDGQGAYPLNNTGLFEHTGRPEDMGRFRAPSLRNVALTAPYMHDGSIATLEAVVRHYEAGGRHIPSGPLSGDGRLNPHKSGFVVGFSLTDNERTDLVAFLQSLTDEAFIQNPRFADPFAPTPLAGARARPR